jgi:hypothetical protein
LITRIYVRRDVWLKAKLSHYTVWEKYLINKLKNMRGRTNVHKVHSQCAYNRSSWHIIFWIRIPYNILKPQQCNYFSSFTNINLCNYFSIFFNVKEFQHQSKQLFFNITSQYFPTSKKLSHHFSTLILTSTLQFIITYLLWLFYIYLATIKW